MRDTITLDDASGVALSAIAMIEGREVLSVNEAKEYKREQE